MILEIFDGKSGPDHFIIPGEKEFRSCFQDVGDHHQDNIILLILSDLFKRFEQFMTAGKERIGINGRNL